MIGKLTIKEKTYMYLRDKILSGELHQGERINIEQLSEQLDISNTPIREAINMLMKEGLIEFDTNHGIKVIKLTERDITEISDAIAILLVGGYKLCLEKSKMNELITEMEVYLKKQEEYFETGNNKEFIEYAIKFDKCLVTVSENRRLVSMLNNLQDLFYLVVQNYHATNVNQKNSLAEHKELLEAIKQGNHLNVENILKKHYESSLDWVIKYRT